MQKVRINPLTSLTIYYSSYTEEVVREKVQLELRKLEVQPRPKFFLPDTVRLKPSTHIHCPCAKTSAPNE